MPAFRQFPALVVLMLVGTGLMLVPAAHAAHLKNWDVARTFLYHAVFFAILATILGIATSNWTPRHPARYHLMTLLVTYMVLPWMLGAPLVPLVPGLTPTGAYFEMVSALTTTGATLFDRPRILPESLHLWRALVGWAGGLLVLVSAVAILAPLNLGGFEIGQEGVGTRRRAIGSVAEATRRLQRHVRLILPVYASFTGLLMLALVLAGERPFVAVCHAMAVLSTSGITPLDRLDATASGRLGEIAMFVFFLPALTHRALSFDWRRGRRPGLHDPQIQLALITVLSVTLLLFLRSFIGAAEIQRQDQAASALMAVWGSLFTVTSFLTTTGFESHDWRAMQLWSNLPDPGAILLGVAVMGGGIATTAGGVKLLRLFALYRQGVREMDLLVHPSAIIPHGQGARLISDHGPRIAFVFLMLFLVSVACLMILLSATGLDFDHSLTLAIAALTTTGQAIRTLPDGVGYGDLGGTARTFLCIGMIVGRMETLVIIALFNPAFWRR